MPSFTDIIYRVYDDNGTHFVEVGPWAEAMKTVELRTHGESAAYFGCIQLTLSPNHARQLAEALVQAADNVEGPIV
jgi:hypothetical protein